MKLQDDLGILDTDKRFDAILSETAKYEGGYTEDHAGPTNFGVTQDTYDSYRKKKGLSSQSVKMIAKDEVRNIAHEEYFTKPNFDKLPDSIAEVMFDFGFHSGPARAAKELQKAIGAVPDGNIGPKTLNAAQEYLEKNGEKALLQDVVDRRKSFLEGLIKSNPAKYKKYENGWMNRIKAIKSKFDLSALNPFGVSDAEASSLPKLEDDLGLMDTGKKEQPLKKSKLRDDLGIMGEEYSKPEDPRESLTFFQKVLTTKPADLLTQPVEVFDNIKESFRRGSISADIDQASYLASIGKLDFDKDVRPLIEQRDKILESDPIKSKKKIVQALYSVAEMLPAMIEGSMQGASVGLTAAAGAGIAGQLGPQVALPEEGITVPLAYSFGQAAGSFEYWRRQGAGSIYADMKMKEVDDKVSIPVAEIGGSLYGAIEFSQVDKLFPGSEKIIKGMISDTLMKTVGRMAARYGMNWAQEVGEEGLQKVVTETSKVVAERVSGKSNEKIGKSVGRILLAGWNASKESALPMLLLMAPGATVDTARLSKLEKGKTAVREEVTKAVISIADAQKENEALAVSDIPTKVENVVPEAVKEQFEQEMKAEAESIKEEVETLDDEGIDLSEEKSEGEESPVKDEGPSEDEAYKVRKTKKNKYEVYRVVDGHERVHHFQYDSEKDAEADREKFQKRREIEKTLGENETILDYETKMFSKNAPDWNYDDGHLTKTIEKNGKKYEITAAGFGIGINGDISETGYRHTGMPIDFNEMDNASLNDIADKVLDARISDWEKEKPKKTKGDSKEWKDLLKGAQKIDTKPKPAKSNPDFSLKDVYDNSGEAEKDVTERGSLRPEKNLKKEAEIYVKEINKILGWEHDTNKKGKVEIVRTNIAPIGGDVTAYLWKPGSEYGVYIDIQADRAVNDITLESSDNLEIESIMYRATSKKDKFTGKQNNWADRGITAGELAQRLKEEVEKYEGSETKPEDSASLEYSKEGGDFSIQGGIENDIARIDNITVGEKARRQGIGSREVKAFEAWAIKNGVDTIQIEADRKTMGFWKSLGYTIEEGKETDSYWNGYKELKPSENVDPSTTLPVKEELPKKEKKSTLKSEEQADEKVPESSSREDGGDRVPERGDPAGDIGHTLESESDRERRDLSRASLDEGPREEQESLGNYRITDADNIGEGTPKAKFKRNSAAIKLLKKIEEEGRHATPEEQSVLVKYVGWGGMPQVFDYSNWDWRNERDELSDLLTSEEIKAARASTISAYYTSPEIIRAMWATVKRLGFEHGKVLEPAAGVGHFIGLGPRKGVSYTAVELDSITGRIAKQLYQHADVHVKGLQEAQIPPKFYDLSISNVPFSDYKPFDKNAQMLGIPKGLVLHDYFFAKALSHLKPGGLMAFITSKGTMDKADTKFREYLNDNAEFIGALRLPDTAFKKNAGTEVVTDIIFLRKLHDGEVISNPAWLETTDFKKGGKSVAVNKYFIDNPTAVLGQLGIGSSQYGDSELIVKPFQGSEKTGPANIEADIERAVRELFPEGIYKKHNEAVADPTETESIPDSSETKVGAFVIKDEKVYQKEAGQLVPAEVAAADIPRLKKMVELRNAVRDLLSDQYSGESDATIKKGQEKITKLYDAFVKKYGFLNDKKNEDLFWDDPDAPLLSSLEVKDRKEGRKQIYKKHDIFSKRVLKKHKKPSSAASPKDALNISLGEYGRLNWDYMSSLLNTPKEKIVASLVADDLIYKNPEGEEYELKDDYLSGNVKRKLKQAQTAARLAPEYNRNIEALEKVIPADLTFDQISVKLGMPWIEPKTYEDFFSALGIYNVKVLFNTSDGSWNTENDRYFYKNTTANMSEWGTDRVPATSIFEHVANAKPVKVFDTWTEPDGTKRKEFNEEATALAEDKAELMKVRFREWFWENSDRREKYLAEYNENWNNTVNKKFDGAHLVFPSMNPNAFPQGLRKTQLDAIWRGITSDRLMLAHEVGAGKTAVGIAIAMESKRLGLSNKTMVVAQKNIVPGWRSQINQLYPSAKILVADEKNFDKKRRKKFLAKIATGDWDIVVIPESSFERLQVRPETYEAYINEEIESLRENVRLLKEQGSKITVKQLEKKILQKEQRLKEVLDQSKKDDVLYFEELGVDSLIVDEADRYKNVAYSTVKQGIKGMGTAMGANKTADMMMKTGILRKENGKIIFATGTPISNSMVEAFAMMRYLQPEMLEERGISTFDAWSNAFGEVLSSLEVDVTGGQYKVVSRFAKFVNVQELMNMLRMTWDIQTGKMLEDQGILVKGKQLPLIKGGKAEPVILESYPELDAYIQHLIERAEKIKERKGPPKKGDDIMLTVLSDGLKAAIDMRMIDPMAPAHPKSKVEHTIRGVYEEWENTNDVRGTQLIFIDRVAPNKSAEWNPHYYMKDQLVKKGIPANQIAFIHDYDTDVKKEELFDAVNDGRIRVVFGSTEKMGAGTNVQQRLTALWHIDVGYRPRDIFQREGRIVRPGNTNKEVKIYRLATKGSLDTFMFQMLEAKAKSIEQILSGDADGRTMDEDEINEFEAIKALSSANPLVKEKAETDKEVRKLLSLKKAYQKKTFSAEEDVKRIPAQLEIERQRAKEYEDFINKRPAERPQDFSITIAGKEYTKKEEALEAIQGELRKIRPEDYKKNIKAGSYLGFDFYVGKEYVQTQDKILNYAGVSDFRGSVTADAVGTFASIDNAIFKHPEDRVKFTKAAISELETKYNYSQKIIEAGFEKQDELDKKVKRQIEVNRLLKGEMEGQKVVDNDADVSEPDSVKKVEQELGEESVDDLDFMNAGVPLFPQSQKKAVNDTIQGDIYFSEPDIEARYKGSKGIQTANDLKQRLKVLMADFFARATRVYPTLPNNPEYAGLRNILSKQKVSRSNAQDRAIRAIDAITAGFGPKKLDLFTRKIILDDLAVEKAAGRKLPFGYSEKPDALDFDKFNIDRIVENNLDVKAAVEKRKKLWNAITNDLVEYNILSEEQIKADYFRHQVLEYAAAKSAFGSARKLRTPRPGYAKKRKGSSFDINTDYVQAEFEVMSRALHDIETAKNIKEIEDGPLNIAPELKAEAKAKSTEDKKIDWHDLIPEGYTAWQPHEGNVFFSANSIPQKIVNEVLLQAGTEIGITENDVKKVLAVGAKRKEFVLPIEVADTIDNLMTFKNPNFISNAAKTVTTWWKRWVLMNPRRAFKYNYQNFIGDFDAVIAGDPRIIKHFAKANSELIDVFYKGKPMSPELREFVERGGISTQMTVQELPELNKLEIFQRLADKPGSDLKRHLNLWQQYWQGIGTFTTYRESIMRYAAYLHYKNMFTGSGKKTYGASIKEEIDALQDPIDKAAKVATELLGDYSNITALGQDLRETVIPFYSWMEINVKRYGRLFRNAFDEGWQEGIRASASVAGMKGSFFLAKWLLRAAALTAATALYNRIFFPDDEDELSEYDKSRMHINLGRDENGNIRILRGQSAFSDLLEWVGLDASPTLLREYFDGKASLSDLFGNIPRTDLPAFGLNPFSGRIGLHQAALKLMRGVNPLYKIPFEVMTGKSLPVFDDKSWKVEDKLRHVLKSISLENEYDALMQEPSRGYKRSLLEAFITTQDPEENAYRYIQGEKYKFLEAVKGRGGSGDYYSPRSILYRKYKKALRLNDKKAQQRVEAEMNKIGIKRSDLDKSLATADPLWGLNRSDRAEFINNYLSKKDREVYLEKAQRYYKKTFNKRSR